MQVLEGTRILDFTRHMSGPYATLLLGDFGADVVKIESMPSGDPARQIGTAFIGGESGVFLNWNRSKRSVAVDMRRPESKEIIERLVVSADVLAENFRPGVAEEMGIGYEAVSALNERLIYLSISAFGPRGPIARFPGTDPVVQAMSGVMSITGEVGGGPLLVGLPIADYTAAMVSVQAVLLGLLARHKTGKGQRIDVPMVSALMFGLTTRLAQYWLTGEDPRPEGSAHSTVAPYQVYKAKDGNLVAGAWTAETWPRFCSALGLDSLATDPRFRTNKDRMTNRAELNGILEPLFASKTLVHWEERFHHANALYGPVCSISEALNHPQTQALGLVQTLDHPTAGPIPALAVPILMSETPGGIKRPPPLFGEHTGEVLKEIGYTPDEIDRMAGTGAVHLHGFQTRR